MPVGEEVQLNGLGASPMGFHFAGGRSVRRRRMAVGSVVFMLAAVALLATIRRDAAGTGAGVGRSALSFFRSEGGFPKSVYLYQCSDAVCAPASPDMKTIVSSIRDEHWGVKIIPLHYNGVRGFHDQLWSKRAGAAVFASVDAAQMPPLARTDLRAWVGGGGCAVFLGGYDSLDFMNRVFGFHLTYKFTGGPYYLNNRAIKGTPFYLAPKELYEDRSTVTGVDYDSLPYPEAVDIMSANDVSVVFAMTYKLGAIVYVGSNFDTLHPGGWTHILHAAISM